MALTQVQAEGIGDGEITNGHLGNSGVTAGTYGSSSAIPAITVDAAGRVTAASTNSVTQVGGSNGVDFNDGVKARFGTGNDLEIYHNGSESFIADEGTGGITISGGLLTFKNQARDETHATMSVNGAVDLYHNNNKKFETKSDGVNIIGELECDSLDVDGDSSLSGDVDFIGDDYSAVWDKSEDRLKFNDNAEAAFGTSADLRIYHDGNNSFIKDGGTGRLTISTSQLQLTNAADSEVMIRADQDGEVNLYYNGVGKLNTKSDGVDITGELQCDSLDVDGSSDFSGNVNLGDDVRLRCGTHGDLDIFHSGVNSIIETSTSSTGDLYILSQGTNHDLYLQAADDIFIRPANGEAGIVVNGNGGVELFHNNSLRFETNSSATTMRGGGEHRCEGHFRPWSNNAYDLGTNGDRWRNVYTNDLHLSNEGSTNDVDGTWGSYTIQEGEDDLFLINRRNGKKYKFNLTEVN